MLSLCLPTLIGKQELTLIAKYADEGKILHQHRIPVASNNSWERKENTIDRLNPPIVCGHIVRTVPSALGLFRDKTGSFCSAKKPIGRIKWILITPPIHGDGIQSSRERRNQRPIREGR